MDLAISSETYNQSDYSWLGSRANIEFAKSGTLLIASATKATHYPDGYIKAGTLLAEYTSGANQGLLGVYVNNDTVGEGLGTSVGVAFSDFRVKESGGVAVSTVTAGAVLYGGHTIEIVIANLPGLLLEDGTTAYAPVLADLPSGFIARPV